MRISIASDHAGFEQKQALALLSEGIRIRGVGSWSRDDGRVDYPDFAELVADDVASGVADFGVLVCGTGIGMAVAANKVNGIRAVNVVNTQFAELAREHNDANIVTLSGRFVDLEENKRILSTLSCRLSSAGGVTRGVSRRSWPSRLVNSSAFEKKEPPHVF